MVDIILLEPEHEGNVGAVCRAIGNFDFNNLVIINPKCNLEGDELYKRAKHSKKIVKSIKVRKKIPKYDILIGSTSKVFSDYNVSRSPLTAEQLADKISRLKTKKKIGIVFGRESIGLTNDEIKMCNFLVSIDTAKNYPILNLSHAVALILYEIYKKTGKKKLMQAINPAGSSEYKQITKMTNTIVDKAKFSTKQKASIQKQIWKNVFSKSMMTKREAFGVMGLLNKISKKIRIKK